MPRWPAVAISSIAFAAHHVIVLTLYFGALSPATWLLSLAIVLGGVFWAWLYDRRGSVVGPWASHMIIDAGIFWIGFELVRDVLASS
jgi:membrane protease YdiL (CAAX protease family)